MASDISAPARFSVAVTPSDATVLSPTRGIYVGVAGDLVVRMYEKQNVVTFSNCPVGLLPVQVDQVRAATAAGSIVALW